MFVEHSQVPSAAFFLYSLDRIFDTERLFQNPHSLGRTTPHHATDQVVRHLAVSIFKQLRGCESEHVLRVENQTVEVKRNGSNRSNRKRSGHSKAIYE